MPKPRGILLSTSLITLCLYCVYLIGVSNLKINPINRPELESLTHIHSSPRDSVYSLNTTLESVASGSAQHAPLYFVFINLWGKLVGTDLFVMRLLSVFFGLLSIAMIYRLAMITQDRTVALITVLMTSSSAFFLYYTHEVRMYSLLPFLSAWVIWAYWSVKTDTKKVSLLKWGMLYTSATLLLFTHYFGIFILVSIGLYHLLYVRNHKYWMQITGLGIFSVLTFSLWLPVAISGFTTRQDISSTRLNFIESIETILTIHSNGFILLAILFFVIIFWNYRRLSTGKKYIILISIFSIVFLIVVNEISAIVVPNRMRYTTILIPALLIGFASSYQLLPKKQFIAPFMLIIWFIMFVIFNDSQSLRIFNGVDSEGSDHYPHYQKMYYLRDNLLGQNEDVLSFHPSERFGNKILLYNELWLDRKIVHIHDGVDPTNPVGRSYINTINNLYDDLNPVWVLYDPQQTDLSNIDVYADLLSKDFTSCKTFIDEPTIKLDYYLPNLIPCDLVASPNRLAIDYGDSILISNIIHRMDDNQLNLYFWWSQTLINQFGLSLQTFDMDGNKIHQLDQVITEKPITIYDIDVSGFDAGEYVVKLIIYSSETGASQSGVVAHNQQFVERELDILHFEIE